MSKKIIFNFSASSLKNYKQSPLEFYYNQICKEKKCLVCQKKFFYKSSLKKYCSKKCKNINIYRLRFKEKNNIKKCLYCGKDFLSYLNVQKYCSKECYDIKRKKDKKNNIKKCLYCGKDFIYNRLKYQNLCSDNCIFLYSHKKIKCFICGKDFYFHKREVNRKLCSQKCFGTYRSIFVKKHILTEEQRKKMKKFQSNPIEIKKKSERMKIKWKDKNYRKKIIENNKKSWTEEKRIKQSKILTNFFLKNNFSSFNHKRFLYKNKYFRSSWELIFVKWLDKKNIKWEYESKKCIFKLSNGKHYIVDFYLPEIEKFVEVKGRWDERAIYKCDEFVFSKGFNKLLIIDKNNIKNIDLSTHYSEQSKRCFKFQEIMNDCRNGDYL